MSKLLRLAATVEFSLVLAQEVFHPAALPLGGAHAVQIALCLGLALISGELYELSSEYSWSSINHSTRKSSDRRRNPSIVNFYLADIQLQYSGVERRNIQDRRVPAAGGRRASDFRRTLTANSLL